MYYTLSEITLVHPDTRLAQPDDVTIYARSVDGRPVLTTDPSPARRTSPATNYGVLYYDADDRPCVVPREWSDVDAAQAARVVEPPAPDAPLLTLLVTSRWVDGASLEALIDLELTGYGKIITVAVTGNWPQINRYELELTIDHSQTGDVPMRQRYVATGILDLRSAEEVFAHRDDPELSWPRYRTTADNRFEVASARAMREEVYS